MAGAKGALRHNFFVFRWRSSPATPKKPISARTVLLPSLALRGAQGRDDGPDGHTQDPENRLAGPEARALVKSARGRRRFSITFLLTTAERWFSSALEGGRGRAEAEEAAADWAASGGGGTPSIYTIQDNGKRMTRIATGTPRPTTGDDEDRPPRQCGCHAGRLPWWYLQPAAHKRRPHAFLPGR